MADVKARVYFTREITPEGVVAAYRALAVEPEGRVAVKLHSGESEKSNHLRPEMVAPLVQGLGATIVESNTAYPGNRGQTEKHRETVERHGFTAIAPVDIQDADGDMPIPVVGGRHLSENFVGSHFDDYDFYVVLSHFKGHMMGGFGGAVKNTSIGIASSRGKTWIHSAGTATTGFGMGTPQDDFLESMAEAAKSVSDRLGGRMLFINVMNRLSIDCDCDGNPHEPDMHDIGVLASLDPVALDQACVDLVYAAPDGGSLIARMEEKHGVHTLEHAEAIGLGSRAYELVSLD